MLKLLSITLSLVCLSHAVVINDVIDALLDSARTALVDEGKDTMTVADISKHFELKIFAGFSLGGDFSATGGTLKNVSSFERTGDVTLTTSDENVLLSFSMGLETLEVNFTRYDLTFLTITSTGSLYASCSNNSMSGVISLQSSGDECSVTVESASVDTLDGFDVQLSGPGDFNKIGNVILPWILSEFNGKIKSAVSQRLASALQSAIENVDLCSQI